MSEFTIHDEKVINHAHFHQESESQGTPPNWTKNVLHRLLAELRGEKRIIAFVDTIPRITGDVGKILDGTTNPAGRSDIPTWFHEIVWILTTNWIKCRIRPTGGLIIWDPRTDRYLQLYLAFDKSTWEYIEHFDWHKLVYTNIFQVLERIEAHDFDIGVHVSGGWNYNRKHLTTGLENAQISWSWPSLISRQGWKLPRNQETNPDSTQWGDARFLITGEKNSKIIRIFSS